MLTDVKIQCKEGQGEPKGWVTYLKGGVQALMVWGACGRGWSSVGLCPLNASVSLITGKEAIPFHLWVRIQEGTMTESLTRFPPGKNRGSLEEHRRSDLRRREKTAQGSTTRSPPLHPTNDCYMLKFTLF